MCGQMTPNQERHEQDIKRTENRWLASQVRHHDGENRPAEQSIEFQLRLPRPSSPKPHLKQCRGEGSIMASTPRTATGRCAIMDLPDELLLLILEYLVPTGMNFHIFPHSGRPILIPDLVSDLTAVHSFAKPAPGVWPPTDMTATAAASVCQRFAVLYHPLLYGGNSWIFEMAMEPLLPDITGKHLCEAKMASRTRVFDVRTLGIWPLTARTAQYVKHLTMLVTLTYGDEYHEVQCLAGQLRRSVAMFTGSKRSLRSLTVDVGRTSRAVYCTKTPATPRPLSKPPGRLEWVEKGPEGLGLKLHCPGVRSKNFEEDVEVIWEALRPLRGVKDVRLSGIGSEGKAEQLAESIRSTEASVPMFRCIGS